MKALVFHGVGEIRLDDVPDPHLEEIVDVESAYRPLTGARAAGSRSSWSPAVTAA
jgi:hypothetical protein